MWKTYRNDDYTTGNLLDSSYYQNNYKLTGIDLSKLTNTSILPEIKFLGKLEEGYGTRLCYLCKISI